MGVDKERIVSLIGEIEKSLSVLKEYGQKEKELLVEDLKSLGSAKYYLIVAVEVCIDISKNLIL